MKTSVRRGTRYSAGQQQWLLKNFDRTCGLMEPVVAERYGEEQAEDMRIAVRAEFRDLLEDLPRIPRARMLSTFLIITAQELAAYKGLKPFGLSVEEIWQLCHHAIRLKTNAIPKWKRWLLKQAMFSRPMKRMLAQRAALGETGQLGGFELEYLPQDSDAYDLGINYRACCNYKFVMEHGGAEFAPYVCMSDIALSEAMGWGLVRTQTLADGCDHCDFRMTKGGPTCITSKTPEVQRVVDLIRTQELTETEHAGVQSA